MAIAKNRNRFVRNVSVNTLQLILNQLFGLIIFYALSKGIDKDLFGHINWTLAILLTVFGILTFGIDQLMVKKIASGENLQEIFRAYFFHVITSGFAFYFLLAAFYFLSPGILANSTLLLFIGTGKLFIFLSTPFKQVAAGLEKFTSLLYMSVVSNIIRGVGLLVLLLLLQMTITNILIVFISGDLAELIACYFIARPIARLPLSIKPDKILQLSLLKESLPQAGVVIFSAILARFDWILIGLVLSASKLAEYSFAWKIFEISTLSLFILAPIMVPLFTRIYKEPPGNAPFFLLEWQVITGSFIALTLNVCWIPIMEFITDGKYGAVNSNTIFILSLSMPLLYFNNYLWTINFAKGLLKEIFRIMAISVAVNIGCCIFLVPAYGNEGAAFAYLATTVVQLLLYTYKTFFPIPGYKKYLLLSWPAIAFCCGWMSMHFFKAPQTGIAMALLSFLLVVMLSRQVKPQDWKKLQSIYG